MLNLGGLYFTLDANTRGLQNAVKDINAFAKQVDTAFKGLQQGTVDSSFANGLLKQERAVVSMLERVKTLQDQINKSSISPGNKSNLLKDLNASYEAFAKRMATPVPLNTAEFSRSTSNMSSMLRDTSREFTSLNAAAKASGTGLGNFTNVMRGIGSASLLVQGHLGGISTRFFALTVLMKDFGVVAALVGGGFAGIVGGLGLMGDAAIDAGRKTMALESAMNAVTGNAAMSAANLKFVHDVSLQTGASFIETAQSFTKFAAAGMQAGESMKTIEYSFRGIAAAGAVLHLSTEQMQGTFMALEQMLSKGTVQSQELRLQLGNQFPAAFGIAAKAVGKTSAELEQMLKKGQVVSATFVPAFVKAAMEVYHIDLSKPVDTLNASLGRLATRWYDFGSALNNATGATAAYKSLIDQLGNALVAVSANLPQIIGLIGGVTGALIGVGVTMGVIAAMPTIIAAATAAWGAMGIVLDALRGGMIGLGAAQTALNALMVATPIGRIVTLLVALAAGIGGAVLGYNLLKGAVDANNAAMTNTNGIESYIQQQKRLGYQIAQTTMEMQKQALAVVHQQGNEAKTQAENFRSANTGPSASDYLWASWNSAENLKKGLTVPQAAAQHARDRANEALKAGQSALRQQKDAVGLVNQLQDLSKLPEQKDHPVTPLPAKVKKAPKDSIDHVNDLIEKWKGAQAALTALTQGGANSDFQLADDLAKAKEAINQMDPKQIGKVTAALDTAGIKGSDLAHRLAVVITQTRQAEEAANTYKKVWNDLDDGSQKLKGLGQQLDYLKKGGNPKALFQFDNLDKATKALEGLKGIADTPAGIQALTSLQNRMSTLGITVQHTGNLFDDTRNALADFFNESLRAQALVQIYTQIHDAMQKTGDELGRLTTLTAAYNTNQGKGAFFNADIGEAADKAIARGQAVRDLARELASVNPGGILTQDDVKTLNAYLDSLRQVDDATVNYERIKETAEAGRTALKDMAHAGSDAFKSLVTGTKTFASALMDLAQTIMDSVWKRFVDLPIDQFLDNLGKSKGKSAAAGLDSSVAGLAANDNDPTGALSQLTGAANASAQALSGNLTGALSQSATSFLTMIGITHASNSATTSKASAEALATVAVNALSAAASAAAASLASVSASGGGGAGGLLSAIFGGGGGGSGGGFTDYSDYAGLAGGGKISGAGTGTSDSILAMINGIKPLWVSNGEGIMTAKAVQQYWPLLDAMNKGQIGKIFGARKLAVGGLAGSSAGYMTGASAYMTQNSPLTSSQNGSIMIDASTKIDARGATAENISDLRREMSARDKQLRSELPILVDSRVKDSRTRLRYG